MHPDLAKRYRPVTAPALWCLAAAGVLHALVFWQLVSAHTAPQHFVPPPPTISVVLLTATPEPMTHAAAPPRPERVRPQAPKPPAVTLAAAPVAAAPVPAPVAAAPPAPVIERAPATAADAQTTPPRVDAAYGSNPRSYPRNALRQGQQGTVLLRVLVSAAGAAVRVEVERSSGWPMLDQAARSDVGRWRFVPSRRGGEPVEEAVDVPVTYRLDEAR